MQLQWGVPKIQVQKRKELSFLFFILTPAVKKTKVEETEEEQRDSAGRRESEEIKKTLLKSGLEVEERARLPYGLLAFIRDSIESVHNKIRRHK